EEVAVLRLPQHKPLRLLDVVAVLEAERRLLGERAIVDLEGRPRLWQRRQRRERLASLRIVEHGMALAERPPLDVLPGHADGDALCENGREGQFLSRRPVYNARVRVLQRFEPPRAEPLQLAVQAEAVGQGQQRFVERLER